MRNRFAVIAVLASIGLGTVGAGVAHAGSNVASTNVLSDKITLVGKLVPGPIPGVYTFGPKKCSLTSDTETPLFPCQSSGGVTLAGTGASGFVNVVSADGSINWNFTLTAPSASTYVMRGTGTEQDNPEAGTGSTPYAAVMKGTATIVGSKITIVAKVKELATQP